MLFASSAAAQDLQVQRESAAAPGEWEFQAAVGISTSAPTLGSVSNASDSDYDLVTPMGLRVGLSERLQLSVLSPMISYHGGTSGEAEWIPWGGLTHWGLGYSSVEGLIYQGGLGAGIGVRQWLSPNTALNFTARLSSAFGGSTKTACEGCGSRKFNELDSWRGRVSAGITQRFGKRVTFNLGIGASQALIADASIASRAERERALFIGSVQDIGLRRLPLGQVWLNERWAVDGYASLAYRPSAKEYDQQYLLGITRVWK